MAKNHIEIKITGDTKKLNSALGDAESKLSKFGSGLKSSLKVGGIALAGLGGAAALAAPQVLQLGAQLEATAKKAQTVLGGSLGEVESWAKDTAGALGLTSQQLIGLTANTADLLKPMGFAADVAADMAMQTNDLAGALSAWTGGQRSAAEVSEILTKAYLGERDGLKALGIAISEADVTARLAAKGQDELTGAALQQAKALATQELILEKSTDAQTAWTDGSMDAVRAQNESRASMEQLKESLVRAVYPALEALVPIIEKVATWLGEKLPPVIGAVVEWFEKNWPKIRETTVEVFEAVQKVIEDVWAKIEPIVKGAMDVIQGVIKTVMSVIKGDWGSVWDGIKQIVSGVWDAIKQIVGLALEGLKALMGLAWDGIKAAVRAAWEWVKREVREAIQGLVDQVSKIPALMLGALGNLGKLLANKGREIIQGLIDGVNAKWDAFVSNLRNKILGARALFSPLRRAARDAGAAVAVALGGGAAPKSGSTGSSRVMAFDNGGVVPGPVGAPQMALVHGGETVLPTHKSAGFSAGNQFNITVNAGVGTDGFAVGQQIVNAISQYERSNGSGWRAS